MRSLPFNAHPDHPAVSFLVQLHADIGGRIKANRQEAKRLADAMRHVEAVIKLFDPAYSLRGIAARRRNRVNTWYKRGTMGRAVLDVLRASEPLTAKEIAVRLLQKLGHAAPDPSDVRELENGVRSVLRETLAKHLTADNSRPAKWRLRPALSGS
jgi:hypothetical protein